MKFLKELIGSGDKIMLITLPFIVIGLILNFLFPHFFSVGGPSEPLKTVSFIILFFGIINWLWSVVLILIKVPKKELITYGPYALNKHPIYNGVAFLVLPWLGFLLNSWLGVVIGIALYFGSRVYSPKEEAMLAETFGPDWDEYAKKVLIPWI
jgi:protein-S-isoprenylcysteine O-methyltransferase Ste14